MDEKLFTLYLRAPLLARGPPYLGRVAGGTTPDGDNVVP